MRTVRVAAILNERDAQHPTLVFLFHCLARARAMVGRHRLHMRLSLNTPMVGVVRYIHSNRCLDLSGKRITVAEDQTHHITAIIKVRTKKSQ